MRRQVVRVDPIRQLRREVRALRLQAKWVKAWLAHAEKKHPVAASCLWDWLAEAAEESAAPLKRKEVGQ